jgi:hypothetical protein
MGRSRDGEGERELEAAMDRRSTIGSSTGVDSL